MQLLKARAAARKTARHSVFRFTGQNGSDQVYIRMGIGGLPPKAVLRVSAKEASNMALEQGRAKGLSIGIIMDGNGRWAKKRGLPRTAGHTKGAEVFRDIIR